MTEMPTSAEMLKLASDLREHCVGRPHAKVPWPHYALNKAADALEVLASRDAKAGGLRDDIIKLIQFGGSGPGSSARVADAILSLDLLAAARAEGERAMRAFQHRLNNRLEQLREGDAGACTGRYSHALRAFEEIASWLPIADPSPPPAEDVEGAVLAERENHEAFSEFHDQQWMEAIDYAADVELIETNTFIRAWREGSCEEYADPLGEWADFRAWRETRRARTAPTKEEER